MLIIIPGSSGVYYQFDLPDVFFQGQARMLSRAEARALNSARADNVRKNLHRKIRKTEGEAPDGVLTIMQLAQLQSHVIEYSATYDLPEGEEPTRMGSIEHEAKEIVEEKGRGQVTDLDVREEARKRIISRRKILQAALPDDL